MLKLVDVVGTVPAAVQPHAKALVVELAADTLLVVVELLLQVVVLLKPLLAVLSTPLKSAL